ncbi:MAG: hypothetical protein PF961_15780 [Planctomycetota bacterium]|jgi:hypothetical protein|nr:hypothetical protein [Planctomycetota bacterium]
MTRCLTLACLLCVASVAVAQELPPDSEYVIAQDDGDLYLDGKRIRFWGGIGGFPPKPPSAGDDPYAYNHLMLARIKAYGFNMMRVWGQNAALEKQGSYVKGDGSNLDRYDHMISLCRDNGIYLWYGAAGNGGIAIADDVAIIDEPDTADGWAEAVASISKKQRKTGKIGVGVAHCVATMWDPRLEAVMIRNTARYLDHVNQHTGLRRADDPTYAIWELVNEQWWIVKMVSGKWQKLPKHFRDSLLARWNGYLRDKYGDEAALRAAWTGLKPGESLEGGTIYLAPLRGKADPAALNDANPHASDKFASEAQTYTREDFSARRGADVNEFLTGLVMEHKRRVAAAFKANGKSTKLSSVLWDTGIGYNGISQLIHQEADAVSHCTYIGGWTQDQGHQRYPWYSGLEEQPRLCQNVPWIEHNTVEGKPYFVYETQIGAPAKYRTEFPYRLLYLAAVQGWDAICWHTMSGGYDFNKGDAAIEGQLAKPGHAAYQFTYKHDATQLSAMRAVGDMFTGSLFEQAPNPTTFIWGRNTLYHPDNMSYAGSYGPKGMDMLNTAYRYGSRIRIDLEREDDEVIGPTVPFKGYAYPNPLQPTDQMTYDWNRGFLRFDAPGAAAFVGFLPGCGKDRLEFANGVVVSDITIASDAGMTHGVSQAEGYVAIALSSADGKALADCSRATISAVSTSHNAGLEVGPKPDVVRPRHAWDGMQVTNNGGPEQLYSRVGCTITAPAIAGMRFVLRDWHMRSIGEGTVDAAGVIRIPEDQPVFIVELAR